MNIKKKKLIINYIKEKIIFIPENKKYYLQLRAFSKIFKNYQIGSCNFWGKNWRKFSKNSDTPLQDKGYSILISESGSVRSILLDHIHYVTVISVRSHV